VLALGCTLLQRLDIRALARPHMRQLAYLAIVRGRMLEAAHRIQILSGG
jgi:hypothetical protein